MFKRVALAVIARYRAGGGGKRWFGIDCNFEPNCSAYAEMAIMRFGLYDGIRLTWKRIRRCRQPDAICKCLEPVPENLSDVE